MQIITTGSTTENSSTIMKKKNNNMEIGHGGTAHGTIVIISTTIVPEFPLSLPLVTAVG
jgi:hypothetical protein